MSSASPRGLSPNSNLPLSGIRVLEFSHMVMGPMCGMVLADLGADVIKIEPTPLGDNSRRLTGAALGFHPTYNRNKRSLCVDLKAAAGKNLVSELVKTADVIVENFRPGAMDKLGLGYDALSAINPRLVYCACKGFLPGPYQNRTALDEVVQMMGGLAYMTGPPGRPLRTGASVNDVLGGVFGAVAILAALRQRETTGVGGVVQSGLFETNMVLVAQHMAYAAIEGHDLKPYGSPEMAKPWPIYDIFETQEDSQVFVGVVTDSQWRSFCEAFGLKDLLEDPSLATMAQLAAARSKIRPRVAEIFKTQSKEFLMAKFDALGLPYAPVAKPSDMFSDPHLVASGGLLPVDVSGAESASRGDAGPLKAGMPGLPLSINNARLGLRRQPPRVGEHNEEIAREIGLSEIDIVALEDGKVLASTSRPPRGNVQAGRAFSGAANA